MGRSKRNKKKELTEIEIARALERNERRRINAELKKERRNKNKTRIQMEKNVLLAVYDNLLKKCSKHDVLTNSTYLGSFESEPVFNMFDVGGGTEPFITELGSTSVKFEVYEVTPKILENVDSLQSYYEGFPENSYMEREEINTPYGKAFTYFFTEDVDVCFKDATRIFSGDYYDYKQTTVKKVIKLN